MNSWSLLVVEQGLTSGKPLKDHLEALDHYAAIRYVRELACPVTFANRGGTLQLSDAGGDSGAHGDFARWLATAPGTPDTAFTAHRRLVDIRARPGEFRRSAVWAIGCGFGGVLDGFAGRLPGLINNAILLKGCCEPATKGNPTMPKSKAPSKKALTSIEAAKETAASDPVEASRSQDFPIVGIGASAGGLAAIEVFFKAMPSHNETGMAFVVVQHLSPDHRSILTELIQRYTEMLVVEAEDGMEVKPNCVHIIPPNRDMAILGGKLQLFERETPHRVRHPIDFFFRSLAADRSERAICVVLSGTGADGALGVRAVKGEGGMAMAQSPESTEFDGMPRSAIATGLVDYVLAAGAMPAQLLKYVHQIVNKTLAGGQLAARQSPDVLAKICILLRASAGHDFSQYKETTVVRRVERRMALQQIENPADYLRYLQQNPAEVSALFRDLLIGVTNFFRDREAFAALEKLAIPQLVERTASEGTIRVWICGCSTGEEAYSIAILIQEQLERIGQLRRVQIFATDLDRRGTDQARAGLFPGSIEADVSAERLARFFRPDTSGGYRIVRLIRDQLIFSEQNVIKDPPFSKLDLISCRNLLIYLNADLQKRLIPLFHYALNPGGILFLGSAESVGDQPLLFETVERKAKLYRRKEESGSVAHRQIEGLGVLLKEPRTEPVRAGEAVRRDQFNFCDLTERTLLSHFAAAAVLVNGQGEILYFHGRTGNYLEPAPGNVASNIIAMARDGLRRDLGTTLHRAAATREPAYANGLQVKTNGRHVTVNLTILPAEMPRWAAASDLFLVILDEKPQAAQPQSNTSEAAGEAASDERVAGLEQKLRAKDDYIQTIFEEMETSGEEIKSSNEEMQSVNEEMQSANEELETSREELQSANEELATVNAELQEKVEDLSRANSDMNNLLAGTGVGTLFVDHDLRISRFTPSITQIIKFIDSDIGRPLADIVPSIVRYERLLADIRTVLDTLVPIEIEVETRAGGWFILTIRPYRTLENVIEGAVITFVDITKRKLAERALAEAVHFRQAAQIETVGIAFIQKDGIVRSANESFLHIVGYTREELEARELEWSGITPLKWMPHYFKAREDLKVRGRIEPYEGEYLRKDGSVGGALFAGWQITENEAVVYTIGLPPDRLAHEAATSE